MGSSLGTSLGRALGGDLTAPAELVKSIAGADIYFSDDKRVTTAGDYLLLAGGDAYKQSIWHRMETNPGERKRKPRYGVGIKRFVRKPDSQANRDEIRRRVIANLQDDPRTKKVVAVTVGRVLIDSKPVLQVQMQVDTWAQPGRKFTYQTPAVM